jgi:glutamate---cysteine ligase / carboxylate-amine ligase
VREVNGNGHASRLVRPDADPITPPRTQDVRADWAAWKCNLKRPYTIGVEEEVMLLDASDHSLAQCSESVLDRLSGELSVHTSPETHACVVELMTGIHADVAGALGELSALRARLASELQAMGLVAASAGTYPAGSAGETRVSGTRRYGTVAESMRSLAHRDPTLALHVHVGIPDPEAAIRVMNSLRAAVPLLLALAANSPFSQGRDSGFASARTVIFQAFPRTGTARPFSCYADYVGAVDGLIASGAIPDPSFLWWDVRLQPTLGTVEVRVMDAQCTIADSAALVALVHALARLALETEPTGSDLVPEVLAENRFLAARDGLNARLIDPMNRQLVSVRALVSTLLARCREQADAVNQIELYRIAQLVLGNGAERQRVWAREDGLATLVSTLTQCYAPSSGRSRQAALSLQPYEGPLR